MSKPKLYIVEASVLPEVFLKVSEAKELLQTGAAATVAEAAGMAGISRSATLLLISTRTPSVPSGTSSGTRSSP